MRSRSELKPCCEACERNKRAIAQVLAGVFDHPGKVLEIGSGTGQHAVYLAGRMPHLCWYCSDLKDRHAGINAWIAEAGLENIRPPIELDVEGSHWPAQQFDYAFSANTAHILSWPQVEHMFEGLQNVLRDSARFALYGPFNVEGKFTSEGNQEFDRILRIENPHMGIRDRESVEKLATDSGFTLADEVAMPANNRVLVFRKS